MESSENTKLFSRLGKCEVCNEKEAKYTCPRCEVKTCSLPCVTIHKEELNCDGVRNKFMYKHMSNFTNLDLLSDYRFLEETTRNVETFVKDPSKRYTGAKQLPVNLYRLRGAARGRRTILQFLPHNFSRSKENTTYFNWKEQLISWRVEWVFPQADNLKCALSRCVETDPLSKLVNTYLDPDQCEPFYKDKLQFYQSAGLRGVVLLIKAEMKSGTRFYELDASLTLKENLMGKTVIEFPTIYVVLREHKHVFDIIDEEEEIESGTTISKNNLLFNSTELSDSEEEEKEDSDGEKLFQQREGRKRFRGRKRFQHKNRKYPRLNIPNYNTLIKQNST